MAFKVVLSCLKFGICLALILPMVVSKKMKPGIRKTMAHANFPEGFSESTQASTPMPAGMDLFESFKAVTRAWLSLSCESLGEPVEGPSIMNLERCAYLAGPIRGLVNLRADSRFGGILLEKSVGWNRALQTSDEAFRELLQVFCGHLLSSFWKMDGIQAIPSQPCTPPTWPKGKPQAAVALLLDQCPVEIRFWVETRGIP